MDHWLFPSIKVAAEEIAWIGIEAGWTAVDINCV